MQKKDTKVSNGKYNREKFQKDLLHLNNVLNSKGGDCKSNMPVDKSLEGGMKKKKTTKKKIVKKDKQNDKRYFKVIEVNNKKQEIGRYSGSSPQQAAKKAVTRICTAKKISKDKCNITFSIQEMTQGSTKGIYGPYKAKLVKNPKEKWVELGGAIIGKYRVEIKEI